MRIATTIPSKIERRQGGRSPLHPAGLPAQNNVVEAVDGQVAWLLLVHKELLFPPHEDVRILV